MQLYNHFDDGSRNMVGSLERLGYVMLSDPATGQPLAVVDEHSYSICAAAAPVIACKWLASTRPRVLGLIGIGQMGRNALRCLAELYRFEEVRCTSRRPETRAVFCRRSGRRASASRCAPARRARRWPPTPTSCGRHHFVRNHASGGLAQARVLFISLAGREFDPAGWVHMDKVVVENRYFNMRMPVFRKMVESGQFGRERLHADIEEVVVGNNT